MCGGIQAGRAPPLQWSCSPTASRGGHWGAWMPSSISAFEGTCVSIPCRFDFPDELRPAVVHGVWYFNSPYPKNYPPVVFKSRTQVVHESFQGRSRLLGDLGLRNCTLLLSSLSPELGGKYYFRGDLGGYNQYTFSEHSVLDIISESPEAGPGQRQGSGGSFQGGLRVDPGNCWFGWGVRIPMPTLTRQMTEMTEAGSQVMLLPAEEKRCPNSSGNTWEKGSGAQGLAGGLWTPALAGWLWASY